MRWIINWWHKFRGASTPPHAAATANVEGGQDEILLAFLAELDEMTVTLRAAFAAWKVNPQDAKALKELRRGFHTIKGAAPMVGAVSMGSFGKDLEKLIIALAERPSKVKAGADTVIAQAIDLLPLYVTTLRAGRKDPPEAIRIRLQAQNLLR